jgi:hypothetical protein
MQVTAAKNSPKNSKRQLAIVPTLQVRLRKPDFTTTNYSTKQSIEESEQKYQPRSQESRPLNREVINSPNLTIPATKLSHFAYQRQNSDLHDSLHSGDSHAKDGGLKSSRYGTDTQAKLSKKSSKRLSPDIPVNRENKSKILLKSSQSLPQINLLKSQAIHSNPSKSSFGANLSQIQINSFCKQNTTLVKLQGDLQSLFQKYSSANYAEPNPFKLPCPSRDAIIRDSILAFQNLSNKLPNEDCLKFELQKCNLTSIPKVDTTSMRTFEHTSRHPLNWVNNSKTSVHVESQLGHAEAVLNTYGRLSLA